MIQIASTFKSLTLNAIFLIADKPIIYWLIATKYNIFCFKKYLININRWCLVVWVLTGNRFDRRTRHVLKLVQV